MRLSACRQERRRPCVVAGLTSRYEEADGSAVGVGDVMQLGVHTALGPPNQAPTPPLFAPQARRRAMGFEIGRIDHDRRRVRRFRSQPFKYPGKTPISLQRFQRS